ncbi:MAG TPA: hypothetical protein VJZ00_00890 [Thermoanaerobaculia bacterium]|nr:hypothetical protein [Thermoanaerobaculia bacterium]
MSKHNPTQDFYKIGGRSQSEGPDRGDDLHNEKQKLAETNAHAEHPAVKRSAKKK